MTMKNVTLTLTETERRILIAAIRHSPASTFIDVVGGGARLKLVAALLARIEVAGKEG